MLLLLLLLLAIYERPCVLGSSTLGLGESHSDLTVRVKIDKVASLDVLNSRV